MLVIISLIALISPAQSVIHQIGKYVETVTFYEPRICQQNPFYNLVSVGAETSVIQCGLACSRNPRCRRFMFDTKTKICSLFESGENCMTDKNIEDKICFRQLSLCSEENCTRCPVGYYGDTCDKIIKDCSDGPMVEIESPSTLLTYIQPSTTGPIVETQCEFGDPLRATVIQNRDISCSEVNFNRTFEEYENGFGYTYSEYWLGLKHIYSILQNIGPHRLDIKATVDDSNPYRRGYYNDFTISKKIDGYKFSTSSFSSVGSTSLGDALTSDGYSIVNRPFSAYDRDYSNNNCPAIFSSGWWYLNDPVCSEANPNGRRNASDSDSMIHWMNDMNSGNFRTFSMRIIR